MDGCFDGILPYFNQMNSLGDVLVVRHVPSVKDLEILYNCLLENFTSVMCFSFAGDKSISCVADDYVIVASQNTIFNEKEVVFHEPSGLNLLTFSIQKQSGKNISIFVLNDNVDGLTNENKKDQLEAVSDEIQNNSYPGPIVICANRK